MNRDSSFLDMAAQGFDAGKINALSALNLAYIGDAVFEVLVRTYIIGQYKTTGNNLHQTAKEYVRAQAQAGMYYKILDHLTDDERAVLKRGRNANAGTKAKNATMNDYRHATGLEALFGYLYLKGENQRVLALFELCAAE